MLQFSFCILLYLHFILLFFIPNVVTTSFFSTPHPFCWTAILWDFNSNVGNFCTYIYCFLSFFYLCSLQLCSPSAVRDAKIRNLNTQGPLMPQCLLSWEALSKRSTAKTFNQFDCESFVWPRLTSRLLESDKRWQQHINFWLFYSKSEIHLVRCSADTFIIASSWLLPLPPSLSHPLTFFMASLGNERNGSWIQTQEKMPLKASMQGSLCALTDSVLLLEICSHYTLVSTGHGVMIAVFATKQADNHLYVETFA